MRKDLIADTGLNPDSTLKSIRTDLTGSNPNAKNNVARSGLGIMRRIRSQQTRKRGRKSAGRACLALKSPG
jgi:hypothetical protein